MNPKRGRRCAPTPPDFTSDDRQAGIFGPATFNDGAMWLGRCTGRSPRERHATTDELLHLLEGAVEVTILDDDAGAQTSTRPAGSVMVVPRGQWHRLLARGPVRVCGVTGPTDHSDSGGARKREFA